FARIKVPDSLPQLVPLQKALKPNGRPLAFVWLEQVIQVNLEQLFPGMEILESHPFHVTRDADLAIQELEGHALLETGRQGARRPAAFAGRGQARSDERDAGERAGDSPPESRDRRCRHLPHRRPTWARTPARSAQHRSPDAQGFAVPTGTTDRLRRRRRYFLA